jgi:uridine kinase
MAITRIIGRSGQTEEYDRARITDAILKSIRSTTGKSDKRLAETVSHHAEQTLLATYGADATLTVEDIQDIVENTIMESGHTEIARNYIIYRHHRAQLRAARSQPFEMSDIIPYRKIYEVLLWNIEHHCDTVDALNETIRQGRFPSLVRETERRFNAEAEAAADEILARGGKPRVVIIAGPSSSGKTTSTIKMGTRLKKHGIRLKAINVDHYFFELEKHPRDEFGDYDYETPQALDLKLFNRHLGELMAGQTIKTPHYDFKTGSRRLDVHKLELAKNEILLIDSLHGLHKGLTRSVPDDRKFKLYVETLGQIRTKQGSFMRWADNRLMRRMIRDHKHRNLQPLQTITHWHYVRRSELTHIIPFINTADFVINTALPYEMPILKARLFNYFPKAMRKFKNDPARRDAYIRAKRIRDLLRPIQEVADDSPIPSTSLLREFIGGSKYKY